MTKASPANNKLSKRTVTNGSLTDITHPLHWTVNKLHTLLRRRRTDKSLPQNCYFSNFIKKIWSCLIQKLCLMAKWGIIDKKFTKCDMPACTVCMYGKAHYAPLQGKTTKNRAQVQEPTKPGEMVSVDQLVSPMPGFVAQMTRRLITKRYKYATVFVDAYSRLGYIYLQKSSDTE